MSGQGEDGVGLGAIPVVGIGPGSQPSEADGQQLEYISMPREMYRYQAPDIPEPEQVGHLQAARAATDWLRTALEEYRVGGQPRIADISALDAENRELVNQILGEGEVSLIYQGEVRIDMQESVLAGIWRSFWRDAGGGISRDLIEVCDVPLLARRPPEPSAGAGLSAAEPPDDVMNARPILSELEEQLQRWRPGRPAHVVNLTLLPLSEGDLAFLDQVLGKGPVATLSRGYGECQITSTAVDGLWWVRYYNSMGTLILNTLEVTDIPLVACAAQEDLDDSRRRFSELLEPYWKELS
ncbi:MAG TPA: hydrogenase expression/formation protein [Gammaproteobacteria bacterium]|nr:hydrogenase expression/formation protein [Gammaproteobacteria bacterium]